MTTPITKEQLTDDQIAIWLSKAESVIRERYIFSEEYAAARAISELASELQECRKAAMDAEPVAWKVEHKIFRIKFIAEAYAGETGAAIEPLYATPPAPVDNTFIPKNLDRALGVVGVALPESKEEFNFQIERWIQRLIDRVIRYADEFKEQPEPVLPKANPCLKAMMQALDAFYAEEVPERGMLSAFRILLDDTCRTAMLQGKAEPDRDSTCK